MDNETNTKIDLKYIISKIKNADYKRIFGILLEDIKKAIIYNRQFLCYIILSLASCILVRTYTIGGLFSFQPLYVNHVKSFTNAVISISVSHMYIHVHTSYHPFKFSL